MRSSWHRLAAVLALALSLMITASGHPALSWSSLPALPNAVGLAGVYAGVSHGALIAAGGANFPDRPFAEGGQKVWHDAIFALPRPEGAWQQVGRLPAASAYGVSATWNDSVVCVGGGDAQSNFRSGWILHWDGRGITIETLPPLPVPVAYAAGAVMGDTFYVLGGQETPTATQALARAFALDLAAPPARRVWRELPWPAGAPSRIIAVTAVEGGKLYLFSGVELVKPPQGPLQRRYLNDAYAFAPGHGWTRVADLPEPVAAAPSPALGMNADQILVLSGVNAPWGSPGGPSAATAGFARTIFAYRPSENRWNTYIHFAPAPDLVPARVTAPVVPWAGGFAAIGGEIAPGIRTPTILFLHPSRMPTAP